MVMPSCASICRNTSTSIRTTFDYNRCNVGIDCCQAIIPSNMSSSSIEIQTSSGDAADQKDGCKYAFLAEKSWTRNNLSNFGGHVKDLDSVPVVL
ncbi:hypothetical protein CerSpe_119990 [Prunus speciosa]